MSATYPSRHSFQSSRVFEVLKDDVDDLMQDGVSSTQNLEVFRRDFDASIQCGLSLDQVSGSFLKCFNEARPPSITQWEANGLAHRSRKSGLVAPVLPKYPTQEEWSDIRPVFTKLYFTEDRPLKEVRIILEQHHGFVATERMYKERIKIWGLHKNLTRVEKETMIRKIGQRRPVNQTLLNRRPLLHRLERYCKENRISAPYELHSVLKPAFQLAQPIALYGSIRTCEVIMQNIEIYMDYYFTSGPGTQYYKKVVATAYHGSADKALVFVEDEEAWKDMLDPVEIVYLVNDAFDAFESGFIELAFRTMEEGLALVETMFKQQSPSLLGYLFSILLRWKHFRSHLTGKMVNFVLKMASTILGDAHPLSIIANQLVTQTNANESCYIWRALTEALTRAFEPLENSRQIEAVRWYCLYGVKRLGSIGEAQDYLERTVGAETVQKGPKYLHEKAHLFFKQERYLEAETLYRECLESWKDEQQDILAWGTDSESLEWKFDIRNCLGCLAAMLDHTDRINEAKVMWRRFFEFDSKAFGSDGVNTVITGSSFSDFLAKHGFLEEREMLRAECPELLHRREIPKEFW